jgi:hypothetical protein
MIQPRVNDDILREQIRTIHNLSEVALIIYDLNREDLLPTVLEELFVEIQSCNEDNCIKKDTV